MVASGFVEALQARAGREDVIDFSYKIERDDGCGMMDELLIMQINSLGELEDQRRIFLLMENVSPAGALVYKR